MATLSIHGREVQNVFSLLGSNENDMTFSLGWALAQCPKFLDAFVASIAPKAKADQPWLINLQEHVRDGGYTDIEIIGGDCHIIVEAKRRWALPSLHQLERYASRFRSEVADEHFVVISERGHESARHQLPSEVCGHPLTFVAWGDIWRLANKCVYGGNHREKWLLKEFITYLRGLLSMRNFDSNLVYVVALAENAPSWSNIPWIDIVEKEHRYTHPIDKKGYPRLPQNYLGFRYRGQLQSIYHVENYWDNIDISKFVNGVKQAEWLATNPVPHFIYELGPKIVPPPLKSGAIWNRPMTVAIDLLFSSTSIEEASKLTQKRRQKEIDL